MESLRGKVAVVTGAASGIGAAVTVKLAAAGSKVVAVDTNREDAEKLAASAEGEIHPVEADVSEEVDVQAYTRAAVERFGRIDLYHLNAGIGGEQTSFLDATAADFDRVMSVNVRGVFLGLREAFRQFAAQESQGAIVTSASICSFGGGADLVAIPREQARDRRPDALGGSVRRPNRGSGERGGAGHRPDEPPRSHGSARARRFCGELARKTRADAAAGNSEEKSRMSSPFS